MSELNREQIIKALECCIEAQCENCCNLGSWHEQWNCMTDIMRKALSLIKELTEENERLRAQNETLDILVKDLRGRNEGLQRANQSLVKDYDILEDELNECVQTKADTVRKMHSEIEARCIKGGIYPAFVKSTIDQIAKEMVGV